jgi:hypothetical protein
MGAIIAGKARARDEHDAEDKKQGSNEQSLGNR